MRLKIFILLLLLTGLESRGQKTLLKQEFMLNLYSNEFTNNSINQLFNELNNNFLNGFQYKIGNANYKIRAGFQFCETSSTIVNKSLFIDAYYVLSSSRQKSLFDYRFGLEKTILNKNKLSAFAFSDLIYRHAKSNVNIIEYNASTNQPYNKELMFSNQDLGIAVGGGVKYNINKGLYINAETSFALSVPLFVGNFNPTVDYLFNPIKTLAIGVSF